MSRPAWSYSSLSDFVNCPRKYQKVRVTKEVKDTASEEMKWGLEVHKHLELHVINGTPLPDGHAIYEPVLPLLAKVRSAKEYFGEKKLTINANFTRADWFAKNAWCRAVLDVGVRKGDTMWVGDWKTGKRRPGSDQLMLAAALVLHTEPQVKTVKTSYIWLKERGTMDTATYTRDQLPEIWQHFMPKVARLEAAFESDKWPAKPSGLCPWCPVTKQHCEFSKK